MKRVKHNNYVETGPKPRTHFCCVPQGFQTTDYQNAENNVYCQCHQSIYDPFEILQQNFVAYPRPSD